MTARWRVLPDFVIIGAQKSGTTSLYNFLIRHPAIAAASEKEIEYFSTRHKHGELWYRSNFPINMSGHCSFKKKKQTNKPKRLTGEASPKYLFYPTVPDRMKSLLPDVKLIAILRNPVDRAYSHYHHYVRDNIESLSFEDAISTEEERCAGGGEQLIKDPDSDPCHYRRYSYLARGRYAEQLENWFRYYGREQFLILTTEEFYEDPQRILDQASAFLGLPPHPFQAMGLRNLNVGDYKEMSADTRKFLVEYFKSHNERLAKLLRCSFDWDR